MSDQYRVPKTQLPVEIRRDEGQAEKVTLFLGEGQRGPESVSDLLNSDTKFLVAERERGGVVFVNVERISLVTLRDADAFASHGGLGVAADLATEAPLHLELDDGSAIDGVAVYELRASNSRVQDFLNAEEVFFPFFHGEHVSYVNKRRVARVELR